MVSGLHWNVLSVDDTSGEEEGVGGASLHEHRIRRVVACDIVFCVTEIA